MVSEIKPFRIYRTEPDIAIEPFKIFKTTQEYDPFKIYKEKESPSVPWTPGPTPPSITWYLKGAGGFNKNYVSTDWNMTPGDWASPSGWPVTAWVGWRYAKFIAYAGSYDDHWHNSLGIKMYTFQYKSKVQAGNLGDIISLGSTRQLQIGYYDVDPAGCSGHMGFKFYLGK